MKISIVIPVYKKKEIFLANLAHNLEFLRGNEIIVVDDGSKEGLRKDIQNRFSDVTFIEHRKNRGFARAVNHGVEKANGEYVFLLNSDVRLNDRSYETVLPHFDDENVFAVSFKQAESAHSYTGKNIIFYARGFILHGRADDFSGGLNAWAEGGACIVRKKHFISLGGFDGVYTPFYWEDVDLSYGAYKRGWKVLFDPSVLVEHKHETTIGSLFSSSYVRRVALRNQYIFFWKNVTDPNLWFRHIFRGTLFVCMSVVRLDFDVLFALIRAFLKIPRILVKRARILRKRRVSDKEILSKFAKK